MMIITVEGVLPCQQIRGPKDAGDHLIDLLGGLAREMMIAISLGVDGRVLGLDVIALVSSGRNCIEFRDICAGVTRRGGTAMVVAHNHPSGLTTPSLADLDLTVRLLEAGNLLGVEVIDHLIVTTKSWSSLRESTHLWEQRDDASDELDSRRDELN